MSRMISACRFERVILCNGAEAPLAVI